MSKIFYVLCFLLLVSQSGVSQNSINNYKYVVVPTQFEFLKERDQYQISSLTKFLFNKYGFTAYLQDEAMPQDLSNNRCLGMTANVVKESGLFKTKLRIDLKDCNGQIIASSQVGETREKEFAKAYNLALRDAFTTFQNMEYAYQPNENNLAQSDPTTSETVEEQEEIARLKEEIKTLKKENTEPSTIVVPITAEKIDDKVLETKQNNSAEIVDGKNNTSEVWYAQAIENGFQIVDSTPKVVMILYSTGAKDVFTVKDKNAIVFKKEGQWIYSENNGSSSKETPVNIKF